MSDQQAAPSWQQTAPFLNHVIGEAVRTGADAIHLHPLGDGLELRYRRFGSLSRPERFPREAIRPLIDRVKAMSCLDLNERRLPQDGRIKMRMDGRSIDLYVSILPLWHGEKAVLRLVSSDRPLTELGLTTSQLSAVELALTGRSGLVVVTGPTRSGISTTLAAITMAVADGASEVVFIGPASRLERTSISLMIPRPWIGLTTAACLRTAERTDVDAVVVDELDCYESAEVVFKLARRGKLLAVGLPGRDMLDAVQRLVDMGIAGHQLATSLRLVVTQRLAPRSCPACRVEDTSARDSLFDLLAAGGAAHSLEGATFVKADGCADCGCSGSVGWVPFFDVVPVTADIAAKLRRAPDLADLRWGLDLQRGRRLPETILEAGRAGDVTADWIARLFAAGLTTA